MSKEEREEKTRLQELLEMLLKQSEKDAAKSKEAQAERLKIERWDTSPWAERCREFNRIQSCNHLKGNRRGPRGPFRDYNVSIHTFVNGESRIACLWGCGFEVWNKPGWSFKWNVGLKMVKQSTNTATSSEVLFGSPVKRTVTPEEFTLLIDAKNTGRLDIGDENPIRGLKANRQK